MRMRYDEYNPQIVAALENFQADEEAGTIKMLTVNELKLHMVIEEDIHARNGLLLVAKGQEVTLPILISLRNFAQQVGVVEPFRVRVLPPGA